MNDTDPQPEPAEMPPEGEPKPGRDAAKMRGISGHLGSLLIPVDRLVPDPDQPRKQFDEDELERLAGSIRDRGQLQSIRVRYDEPGSRWVVVAGERRYRAAIQAGLATLLCIEADAGQSADERLEDQLVENCLREELKPLERARAFRALLERKGWSYRKLADHLHVSAGGISQSLALLRLPEAIQERVDAGALAPSVAYEIARVDGAEAQSALAARIEAEGMSRREAAESARRSMPRSRRRNKPSVDGGHAVRTFQTPVGRVAVEPKQVGDESAILAALEEAVVQQRARIDGVPRPSG